MCGIAGGVALRPDARPDREIVARMSGAIRHRGPDGEGVWVSPSGSACFAHRRLSVIDLETGQQPIVSTDGDVGLVFNGEIYNYLELRREMEAQGSRFRTESDTEVLLHLLRARGAEGLQDTVGMFAFALWDDSRRTLLMARDRVGKKPLFYATIDGCLYFCSSLVGLEAAFRGRPDVSAAAVVDFLDGGYVPSPGTIYEDVWKLSAATYLEVRQADGLVATERLWRPPMDVNRTMVTEEEALDRLEALLEEAVRLRLRSDVPLGVFLSGGIDSSLVAALSSRMSDAAIQTFTIGFDVDDLDESTRAGRVAGHLGTEHRTFRLESSLLELLPTAVRHFGEPFADSAALPLWVLAEQARPLITVALLGDGGDEGFGGYDWYRTAAKLDRVAGLPGARTFGRSLSVAGGVGGRKLRRLAHMLEVGPEARFADLRCMFGPHTAADILQPAFVSGIDPELLVRNRIAALYREFCARPSLRMQYADLRTYLADGLLPKVDVATMAHGLEARAPLLDHRVLEFAYRLPGALNDPSDPKRLLRKLLDRYVPRALTEGPKRGFTVPVSTWFRRDLEPQVRGLPSGPLVESGYVDRRGLAAMVDEHIRGERDHGDRLFHLMVLSRWLES
jgi:asparagine synthase (glutamine-hydrolysing)